MKTSDSVWIAFAEIRKAPSSYSYAVLIVAISIAAVIVGLSAARGLVRPLPFPDGNEVLRVRAVGAEGGATNVSSEDFALLRANLGSAAEIGAFANAYSLVDLDGEVFDARISFVTENASEILKVEPIIGRWPTADEAGSVVLSFHLWDSIFGRGPEVLNEQVRYQDETWTIAGVMPDGFRFPFLEDMWKVVAPSSESLLFPEVFLRLGDEANGTDVGREMQSILDSMDGAERTRQIQLLGFTDERGDVGETQLLGAVLLVSLAMAIVACTNVCNLLAERAIARIPDLAVHQAVGATDFNVVAQLLTESALLGTIGAASGVGLAFLGSNFLTTTFGGYMGYFWVTFNVNPAICIVVVLVGIALTTFSGLIPIYRLFGSSIADNLSTGLGSVKGKRRSTASWIVINGQLALSFVAAAAAFAIAQAALDRQAIDGVLSEQLWMAPVSFEAEFYENPEELIAARRDLLDSARRHPEVVSAALVKGDFLFPDGVFVTAIDRPRSSGILAPTSYISSGFFEVLEIDENETQSGEQFFVQEGAWANQALVDELIGDAIVVGEILGLRNSGPSMDEIPLIGTVSNLQLIRRDSTSPGRRLYLPLESTLSTDYTLLVRTETAELSEISGITADLNKSGPVIGSLSNLEDRLAYYSRIYEALGQIVVLGAMTSLVIMIIGLFALVSLELESQKKDFAMRKALGATDFDIWLKIVQQAVGLTAPGVLLGLGITIPSASYLGIYAAQNYGIGSSLALVFTVYSLTILLAVGVPGIKQARSNPAQVLSQA